MADEGTENVKPVILFSVDGSPNENPRYPKVIRHVIGHFIKFDIDTIYVVTNTLGQSAYNRVQRRMASFSRKLSGVILEHDHDDTHLNDSGKTVDVELEKAQL